MSYRPGAVRAFGADLLFNLVVNKLLGTVLIPRPLRWIPMRAVGLDVDRCRIAAGSYFGSRRITIHPGAMIGTQSYLDGAARITVESRVALGPRTMLFTGGHAIGDAEQRLGELEAQEIVIGAGSWLCANVTVLPGVRIGAGCVVSAGSIVSRDLAPNGLYAGSPARRVKELPPAPDGRRPAEVAALVAAIESTDAVEAAAA